ncbi:MAG TPA: permease prefix domain 1-containing protein [Candidatus Limnocylindria bacterium]
MPDQDLTTTYLQRLHEALSLSDSERTSAVEEIHAHVELAADEMMERGTPRDAAVRQVLERLGAPDRLARHITAAHRRPSDLLTAAGVAFRVTAATGFKAFVVAWAGIIVIAIALGLAVAGVRRLAGPRFLENDWTPVLDGLMPAAVGAIVAYGIGRALIGPIAIAAHRSRSDVRAPILVIGIAVSLVVSLTAIEARWSVLTALAMASVPGWFALGVLRPRLLPSASLSGRQVAIPMLVFFVAMPLLLFAAGGQTTSGGSIEYEASDPNVAYAAVGRFVDIEHPPITIVESPGSGGPANGPGPIRIERSGRMVGGGAEEWTDLRLEIWQGPVGELNGSALDPSATAPIVTAPMAVNGARVSGTVEVMPDPARSFHYVAVTGLTPDGERVQLAWPGIEHWQWRGTALQFFEALIR